MTSVTTIQGYLERQFDRQRIVMWHDPVGEFDSVVDELTLDGVTVERVANDEFAVKYRLLRGEPKAKFLVYRSGPLPGDVENWLLDLQLAYGVFTADKNSLVAQEIGVENQYLQSVVAEHPGFFRSERRSAAFRDSIGETDLPDVLRAKMIAVLCGQVGYRLADITRTFLRENAAGKSRSYDEVEKYGLADFHWAGVAKIYHYSSEDPSIDDFVLWVYRNALNGFAGDTPDELRAIQLDFSSMRYDGRERETFEILGRRADADLGGASLVADTDFRELINNDLFESVDQKIITDLVSGVIDRTMTAKDVSVVVRERRRTFWFAGYRNLYDAIDAAAKFLASVDALSVAMESFDDGIAKYRSTWFQIDQLYRQFYYYARKAEHPSALKSLPQVVESFYSNKFLLPLGDSWQKQVDAKVADGGAWRSNVTDGQASFFTRHVGPVVRGGRNKLCVVISDAMRYEVGDELAARIRKEDRYEADLGAFISTLPSYTQLGMAALLPNKTLEVKPADPNASFALVDGQPSWGTANRAKILAEVGGTAIKAESFLKLNRDDARDLFKDHQVLYIYQNRIDKTGDSAESEDRVFQEVESTLEELLAIVKKLTAANANNIVITADHGFLYQDAGLDESDYLSVSPQGDEIGFRNRRFTLGRGLKPSPEFITLSASQLGLTGDVEVQIPKSINRVKRPGAGSRFVHGGASLQEVVVPVVTVSKKRTTDTAPVAVELLRETEIITTGQLSVKLLQQDAVEGKVQPRTLRIGLYHDGELISNRPEIVFDSSEPEKADRYTPVQLILTREADALNNQPVELRLEEPIAKTSQWRTYVKVPYTLKRSFTTDFDF